MRLQVDFNKKNINCFIEQNEDYNTIKKTRLISNFQQIIRIDEEKKKPQITNKTNSIIFEPKSSHSIRRSFEKAILLKSKKLNAANKESVRLGNIYNYKHTFAKFIKIINLYLNERNIKI